MFTRQLFKLVLYCISYRGVELSRSSSFIHPGQLLSSHSSFPLHLHPVCLWVDPSVISLSLHPIYTFRRKRKALYIEGPHHYQQRQPVKRAAAAEKMKGGESPIEAHGRAASDERFQLLVRHVWKFSISQEKSRHTLWRLVKKTKKTACVKCPSSVFNSF